MPRCGIIVFQGTNCEVDTYRACEYMGLKPEYIWADECITKIYDLIIIPGGFSYGDCISSGRIAKFTSAIKTLPLRETLIVGICNGFQILCETKLLNGALLTNKNTKFLSKYSKIIFQGKELIIPIAHHQGNFYSPDKINKKFQEQILMTYANDENGSDFKIAGLYDKRNKIIGMMPHPERAIFKETGSTDGRIIFEFIKNEIRWIKKKTKY